MSLQFYNRILKKSLSYPETVHQLEFIDHVDDIIFILKVEKGTTFSLKVAVKK